jgi:hypothetical protein
MRRLDYRPPNEVRLPSILHLDLARTVGSARTPKDVVASSTQPYWRCSDGRTRLRRRSTNLGRDIPLREAQILSADQIEPARFELAC